MKKVVLAVLGTVLLTVNTSAYALFGDDEARKAIIELRSQLKAQQDIQMNLYDRLESLTKEVQTLRGQVDVLNNSLGKERENAQSIYGSLQSRLDEMDPKAKAAQAVSDKEIAAEQELNKCLEVFKKGDANKAIACFSTITTKYRATKTYPTSLYWLGSSYYMKGDFAKTIETENKFIASYPEHKQVSEAYLLVGMAQMDSKKTDEANKTFRKLIQLFPKGGAAAIAKKQLGS
ncbi:tetratricopeptide repeat protein [uncultured Parasutterella sp.]|uniref:tetratricopeptide repeat protein n=1 Tax=uncultured Parasutterella sp. TaxID=1263098 RepID=UPI0025B7A3DA|nr:tetratricopeptide repeat protein [uncultured Parasutterella sp.]